MLWPQDPVNVSLSDQFKLSVVYVDVQQNVN